MLATAVALATGLAAVLVAVPAQAATPPPVSATAAAAPGAPASTSTTASASTAAPAASAAGTVDEGLEQLQALSNLGVARQDVTDAQVTVARAAQAALAAKDQVGVAQAAARRALVALAGATHQMTELAVAAYEGESDIAPAPNPAASNLSGVFGGVSNPSGSGTGLYLDPAEGSADASSLQQIVAHEMVDRYHAAQQQVAGARQALIKAQSGQSNAQGGVSLANARLSQAQQVLTETVAAATTPGLPVPQLVASGASGTPAAPSAAPANASDQATGAPAGSSTPPASSSSGGGQAGGAQPASTSSSTTAVQGSPGSLADLRVGSPSILGSPVLTASELAGWFTSTGHTANTTVPIAQLAQDYISAGEATGVRGDIAFAQSIVETGYFSFPSYGQVKPTDNNFAGIGACDTCATGWSFPDALTGVTAQMQLLEAYATRGPVSTPLVGHVGVGGCCSTWTALTGTWATNPDYGNEILATYAQMLAWAIPQRLAAAGLSAAGSLTLPAGAATGTSVPSLLTPSTTVQAPTLAPQPTASPPTSAAKPGVPQVTNPPPGP